MSVSRSFMSVMHAQLKQFFGESLSYENMLLGDSNKTAEFIANKDVLLLPASVQNFIDSEELACLRQAAKEGQKQVYMEFTCDEGSRFTKSLGSDCYRELRTHISNGG